MDWSFGNLEPNKQYIIMTDDMKVIEVYTKEDPNKVYKNDKVVNYNIKCWLLIDKKNRHVKKCLACGRRRLYG